MVLCGCLASLPLFRGKHTTLPSSIETANLKPGNEAQQPTTQSAVLATTTTPSASGGLPTTRGRAQPQSVFRNQSPAPAPSFSPDVLQVGSNSNSQDTRGTGVKPGASDSHVVRRRAQRKPVSTTRSNDSASNPVSNIGSFTPGLGLPVSSDACNTTSGMDTGSYGASWIDSSPSGPSSDSSPSGGDGGC